MSTQSLAATLTHFLTVLFALCLPFWAGAQVIVAPGTSSLDLAHDVFILTDVPPQVSIEAINTPAWQSRFIKPTVRGSALNLARGTGVVWLRVDLHVAKGISRDWILDIPYGNLTGVQWFVARSGDAEFVLASDVAPPLTDYRYHAQPIALFPGAVTIYGRIVSDQALTLPLQLQTEATFLAQETNQLLIQALYFGMLVMLLVYALLFAWSVKDPTNLIFSAYLLASGFAIFVGNGLGRMFLWQQPILSEPALQLTAFALAGAFSLWLTSSFLWGRGRSKRLTAALRWLAWSYLALAVAILVGAVGGGRRLMLDSLFPVFTLASAVVVIAALWLERAGKRSESYFFAAWMVVWFGAVVAAARAMDWVASNLFTLYVMQIAIGVAALLFSVALFVRVRQQFDARLMAQQEALSARTALVESLQDSERKLEATVVDRTAQLQASLEAEKRLREQYVRFGAMISHEFRNPLGVIETQTSLLQRELKAGIDNSDKRIGTVRSAAQRLALLFEKWLQSDRLQNVMDKLHTEPIEFDEWFEDLVAKCHAYHANHRIDGSLTSPVGVVHADERLLQIAVLNLIENACKYSAAGTTVSVTAAREGTNLRIDVTDQGVGIAIELHAKVFDEYFRVNPDSPVLGVGLGLPFVRKIVMLHRGSVTASHNPAGQGARFTIVMPIRPVVMPISREC